MLRQGVGRCRQGLSLHALTRHVSCQQGLPYLSSGVVLIQFSRGRQTSTDASAQSEPSQRKLFKQTVVDPKVMRHLDLLGLGTEKKNVERTRKMRLYRRGVISSTVPGTAGKSKPDKPSTFDHPTWAVKLLASATQLSEVPPHQNQLPEVALVGRSNVGKSTLLNALLGLSKFPHRAAQVSDTPGTTRTLDFYRLGKGSRAKCVIADMPGYGFAYADSEKREAWKEMMMAYLRGRGTPLKRVMILLDARHGFKKLDLEFLDELYDPKGPSPLGPYHPPKIQIVLTKCDLVKRVDLARRVTIVRRQLDEVSRRQTNLPTMMLSALRGPGLSELQRELSSLDPNPVGSTRTAEIKSEGITTFQKLQERESTRV